jgi:hypothetical protein
MDLLQRKTQREADLEWIREQEELLRQIGKI